MFKKFIAIFLIFIALQGVSQNITVEFKGVSLTEALSQISSNYNIKFAFDSKTLKQYKTNCSFQNANIEHVLLCFLDNIPYDYEELNGIFIIKPIKQNSKQFNKKLNENLISGVVYDSLTREHLPFANVGCNATGKLLTTTNANGFFVAYLDDESVNTLKVSYIGYHDRLVSLTTNNINIALLPNNTLLNEVVVSDNQSQVFRLDDHSNTIQLNAKLVESFPGLGEPDISNILKTMPGVSSNNEASSGLNIRGGSSDQNLVLVDDIPIVYTDHFFGLFSSVNSNIVKDIQLSKGGWEARYGGRVSGLVKVTSKSGNRNKISALASVSRLSTSALVETPIGSKLSFYIAARSSYNSLYKSSLYQNLIAVIPDNNDMIRIVSRDPSVPQVGFYDVNSKLSIYATKKDLIFLSYYHGKDIMSLSTDTLKYLKRDYAWGNNGISTHWERNWTETLNAKTILAHSRFNLHSSSLIRDVNEHSEIVKENDSNNLVYTTNIRNDYNWTINSTNILESGVDLTFYNAGLISKTENSDSTKQEALYAYYVQHKLQKSKWFFSTGIRYNYYTQNKFFVNPRLNVTYRLFPSVLLRSSAGRYQQFISKVMNTNLPGQNYTNWRLADKTIPVIDSRQLSIGAKYTKKSFEFDWEGYFKNENNFVEYTTTFIYNQNGTGVSSPDKVFFDGVTNMLGSDILLKFNTQHYTGWLSYSYVEYTYKSNDGKYDFKKDIDNHEIKIANSFNYKNFDFSINWYWVRHQFNTANNYKKTLFAYYEFWQAGQNNIKEEFLPNPYHRLDFAAAYKFKIKESKCKLGASIFNLYNQANKTNNTHISYDTYIQSGIVETNTSEYSQLGICLNIFLKAQF